ncbi:MAG TPA: class I tRNA ligase family protein, partial [Candidatus Babeliales bacterium]|nr:class I tRNA ligase family protein [Candidatus Babeliales bacterium]
MLKYDVRAIEKKWQARWAAQNPIDHYQFTDRQKKYYCLDMFPYPSGSGLHVGHWRGYVLSDVYARIKLLEGYRLLHPMGWDAFGLPAENDAIKKNIQPKIGTAQNIAHFKQQLHETGALYNWDKELNTTDPAYYKWTQWIFLQMFKAGLAYEAFAAINWCPACLTGLANEEVVNGSCERCGTPTQTKQIRQWLLRISDYAEQLLSGLERLPDWPENVKTMQRNWIGKSTGLLFTATVPELNLTIETFSAHFETFMADSFFVIAPDHPLLETLLTDLPQRADVLAFCQNLIATRLRAKHVHDKAVSGIFTGRYIADPVSGQNLPLWVANFAIADYGTGIVKCSAHDERDFAFAKKYGIPLKVALVPTDPILRQQVERLEICYSDMQNGILLAPAPFAGQVSGDCRAALIDYCEQQGY